MDSSRYMLTMRDRPAWLVYPRAFCHLVEQSFVHVPPWHLFEAQEALVRLRGLADRYPSRELLPFAYRQGDDDIACWSRGEGEKVYVIHDFASPGWESGGQFEDTWSWLRAAVEDCIKWA